MLHCAVSGYIDDTLHGLDRGGYFTGICCNKQVLVRKLIQHIFWYSGVC